MATVLAAIAALGTIVGGLVYLMKAGIWIFKKTPAEKEQEIDKEVNDEKKEVDSGGRPKWD